MMLNYWKDDNMIKPKKQEKKKSTLIKESKDV